MANLYTFMFVIACLGVNSGFAEDDVGEGRTLHRRRCQKYGTCGDVGFQGGYGGYQGGYNGYGGNQGYPPINIGISQSQASSSNGYGGYNPNYPNYYNQYNGYPGQFGYNRPGYNGYNGYNGYSGYNGYGASNNQYNGNIYGGPGYNGYGSRPFGFGGYFDESSNDDVKPVNEIGDDFDDFGRSAKKPKE